MNFLLKPRIALSAVVLAAFTATGAFAADKISIPNEKPVAAAEAPEAVVVIRIAKMKYDTPEVKVKPGDTVVWINDDVMPHNVAFKKGVVGEEAFKGEMLKKDQAYAIKFDEAGTYDYTCTPHPFMRGKVIVE
ncbi:amicyanin [Paracoccus sp. KR1-242]|uniref:amicyanin n=1 Tax=Paracoccus sp. KR1-242 TaxID=3410028 RepID=UPI003BFB7E93